MALSGILKPVDWFINTAPRPIKFIVFLFILIFFIGSITNLFVGDKYYCADGMLVDNREFSKCLLNYMGAYMWKYNITQEECYQFPEAQDPEWNETVCEDLVPTIVRASWLTNIYNSITGGFSRFYDLLVGNTNTSKVGFLTILYDPGRAICGELYDCLNPETNTYLGLSSNCSFQKGFDVTDDFPSIQNYSYYTRINKTMDKEYMDEFKIFQVRCYDFGEKRGELPEFAFFGFPILEWRIWLVLMIFGSFIYIIFVFGKD